MTGIVAVVALAACGGPGSYNDAIGSSAPPGTELPFAGADRVPTPAGPAVTLPSTGRQPISAFCQDVEQLQRITPTLVRPNQTNAALNQAKAQIARLAADAPAAVKPAAIALNQAVDRIVGDLRANPPNGADMLIRLPRFFQAFQEIVQFALAHC